MTDKEKAVSKANALRIELESRYNCAFSCLCNTGAHGFFDMTKYGTPTVSISGNIFSDDYYVTIWEKENGKAYLYSSGYDTIPKTEMLNHLDEFIGHNEQLSLF